MPRTKNNTQRDELGPVEILDHSDVADDKVGDPTAVDPGASTDDDSSEETELELDDETLDPFGDKWES